MMVGVPMVNIGAGGHNSPNEAMNGANRAKMRAINENVPKACERKLVGYNSAMLEESSQ